jgi:TonB-dependent SusC/RagA subfamily outer membrane receptor
MQVSSDVINTLPPCDVESIDVLKGADAAIFGVRGGNGVVSVLTRKGNANYDWSKSNTEGVKIQKRMGYAMNREFLLHNMDKQNQSTFAQTIVQHYIGMPISRLMPLVKLQQASGIAMPKVI